MEQLRLRGVKEFVQGHTVGEQQRKDLKPGP